jgi:hypothetical protein
MNNDLIKTPLAILALIILCGCIDEQFDPTFEFPNKRISMIQYGDWNTEVYGYNAEGLNTQVTQNYTNGGNVFQITYNNGRPQIIQTYDELTNRIFNKDSIVYNSDLSISKKYSFYANDDQEMVLSTVMDITYGADGFPEQLIYSYPNYSHPIQSKDILKWKKGNVVEIEYYDQDDNLRYEFFFEFDNQLNYKYGSPLFLSSPEHWSKNNITKSSHKDYTGLLDTFCNPCQWSYKYDADGLPIRITPPSYGGEFIYIQYETTEQDSQWTPFF